MEDETEDNDKADIVDTDAAAAAENNNAQSIFLNKRVLFKRVFQTLFF
jgi:hypothetical protein